MGPAAQQPRRTYRSAMLSTLLRLALDLAPNQLAWLQPMCVHAHLARRLALLLAAGRQLDLVLVAGQQRVGRNDRQCVQQYIIWSRDTLRKPLRLWQALDLS